jgi:hypothetical protein
MVKIISRRAGPDDPMYKEGYRSYSPHWARSFKRQLTFRPDNTKGYSEAELAELNRRYDVQIAKYSTDERAEKSFCDSIAERVLGDFKAGKS